MTLTPKTIQIYLPGGDPRGILVAEVTTRIVQVTQHGGGGPAGPHGQWLAGVENARGADAG